VRRDTINNTPTGHVERTNLNTFLFDQQYHTFHSYGFAADPTVNAQPRAMIGDSERLQVKAATSVFDPSPSARQLRCTPRSSQSLLPCLHEHSRVVWWSLFPPGDDHHDHRG
jgi:pre-mRNA-processing factor 17